MFRLKKKRERKISAFTNIPKKNQPKKISQCEKQEKKRKGFSISTW